MDDVWLIFLQLAVVGSVLVTILVYLLRWLLCKAQNDPTLGQAILVTGCDSGIGHELARHLDSIGFTVFAACLDTGSEGAQRLRIEASSSLKLVNMDVTREDHVKHAVEYIRENLPAGQHGLYALVNNAGVCVCGEFEWQTWNHIEQQIKVNLLGTMRVTRHCIPLLKAVQGRIVNVSSVAGLYGYPGLSVYCASKHALEGFSRAMRQEMAKFGVSVVTVQPGDFSKATHLLDNHHRNMNAMWSEMSVGAREEYKEYFIRYHNTVAKTGFTGKRVKPVTVLPPSVVGGFEKALLTKVPEDNYLLLPSTLSQLKMWGFGWLPTRVAQYLIGRQYRKSWQNFSTSASDCGSVSSYYSPTSRPPSSQATASSPSTSVRSFTSGSTNYSSIRF